MRQRELLWAEVLELGTTRVLPTCSWGWSAHFVLQVRCWRHDEKEENARKIRTVGNQTSAKVTNLQGNALYHLAVKAYNTAGTGPSSAMVNVTTKKPRECPGQWQCSASGGSLPAPRVLIEPKELRHRSLLFSLCRRIIHFLVWLFCMLSKQSVQNSNHSCAGTLSIYLVVQGSFFFWSWACWAPECTLFQPVTPAVTSGTQISLWAGMGQAGRVWGRMWLQMALLSHRALSVLP